MLKQGLRKAAQSAFKITLLGSLIAGLSACNGKPLINVVWDTPSSSVTRSSSSVVASSSLSTSSAAITTSSVASLPVVNKTFNPLFSVPLYINPDFTAAVDQSIAKMEPNSNIAQKMATVKKYSTAIWMDSIDAIAGGAKNGGRLGLIGHLEAATAQKTTYTTTTMVVVLRNLPDRDCAAASGSGSGSLHSDTDGLQTYKTEYIDVLANTFAQYPDIRIVAIVEPSAYADMLTHPTVPACKKANEQNIYKDGIQYAIAKFADMPNVFTYLDIANAAEVGVASERNSLVTGFTALVKGATPSGNLNVIRGFVSNVASYATLMAETGYTQSLYDEFIAAGFNRQQLGFVVDTSRNGGSDQNTPSTTSDCNLKNAGMGMRPFGGPEPKSAYHIDAYLWLKNPGESDGSSDPKATGFNAACGSADAMANAPAAGQWFHEQFVALVKNANPELIPLLTPPVDTDNDGATDDVDQCPNTPANRDVNGWGCSAEQRDTDKDGINDAQDACPDTETGVSVDANGCPLDTDKDGVIDIKDKCANTKDGAIVDTKGCSSEQNFVDTDKDGVEDSFDACLNTPANSAVNKQGCATSERDSDGDKVFDDKDQCPNTPNTEKADTNGCSPSQADSDKDTIVDTKDKCPSTPTGETANSDGCSASQVDSDNDGIFNNKDTCANTPSGEKADANGCSPSQLDTDKDGISDTKDTCANTPAGETANASGCSPSQLDTDKDGVKDNLDKCSNTPTTEKADNNGCSPSQSDTDGDKIVDTNDQCPNTPAGSTVNAAGCSPSQLDDDKDGVSNSIDTCPNTPANAATNSAGCADSQIDSDKDGVNNALDQCVDTAANSVVDTKGCSAAQRDTDKDGVADSIDTCPTTGAGLAVDAKGCHLDQLTGNATQGKIIWDAGTAAKCSSCHGNSAKASGAPYPIDPQALTKTAKGSIVSFIDSQMQKSGTNCKGQCAADVAAYFLTFKVVASGPTQAQIDARVAAGKVLYEGGSGNSCSACHGADGKTASFKNISITTKNYAEIVAIATTGKGAMPACAPKGNCANQLADYIWVKFLGKTLTTDGGK